MREKKYSVMSFNRMLITITTKQKQATTLQSYRVTELQRYSKNLLDYWQDGQKVG